MAVLLDGALQRQSVHNGGEHADRICAGALDPLVGALDAAKEVAAADNHADLAADAGDLGDLPSHGLDKDSINTESAAGGQGFTGKLQKHTFVHCWL